jgi:hypothetical protein
MAEFGVAQARQRVLDAMYAGNWQIVDEHLTAYAAAVRAEERHRAIGEALETLQACGGEEGDTPVRDCLPLIERLR